MLYSVCLPFGGRGGANSNDKTNMDFIKYSYSMATGDSQFEYVHALLIKVCDHIWL
jgi:hypothetical protein